MFVQKSVTLIIKLAWYGSVSKKHPVNYSYSDKYSKAFISDAIIVFETNQNNLHLFRDPSIHPLYVAFFYICTEIVYI